ncbi:MAG: efflux RND transporter periplasmic adaptor subunit [Bacteroidales bacterium]|nr:efflux RND transporter periplasmic adaptor subunit [Bacteroidales bacterium]
MKKTSVTILISIVIVIVFTLLLIIGKSKNNADNSASKGKSVIKVDAFIVKPVDIIEEISVSGSLTAFEKVDLKNEVAGRVVMINLPEGREVKEGTLLVKLFDDDLQANLKKLQAQLAMQEQILKRQAELLSVNGISQNEYDLTSLQVNTIKADIEAQKAQIRKTEIRAPFDGTIGLRNISLGAEITPSTLLASLRSVKQLKLDFSVPEKYSPEIKPGLKVKFTLYNDKLKFDATVMASEEGIDADTRNLRVRAIVDSHSDILIPGAFANVLLELNENKNALVIPTQSIIPSENDKSVFIAKNGKAHLVSVKTGIRKPDGIEIKEGLQVGDTVITSGILFLREGAKLSYSSIKTDSI